MINPYYFVIGTFWKEASQLQRKPNLLEVDLECLEEVHLHLLPNLNLNLLPRLLLLKPSLLEEDLDCLVGGHQQGFAPECKSGRVSKYGYYPSQYFARVSTGMYARKLLGSLMTPSDKFDYTERSF